MGSGARFSKVAKTFGARKAIRKTPTQVFSKVGPFIWCKENKNQNNYEVSCLETPFVLKIQRGSCHPKCARKVSALLDNGPPDTQCTSQSTVWAQSQMDVTKQRSMDCFIYSPVTVWLKRKDDDLELKRRTTTHLVLLAPQLKTRKRDGI